MDKDKEKLWELEWELAWEFAHAVKEWLKGVQNELRNKNYDKAKEDLETLGVILEKTKVNKKVF
jgi:endonuclease I